jgi:iron complex outermembrane receptor protein
MFTSDRQWLLAQIIKLRNLICLNNTYFGKTTFKQAGLDSNLERSLLQKIVTDLGINFFATTVNDRT